MKHLVFAFLLCSSSALALTKVEQNISPNAGQNYITAGAVYRSGYQDYTDTTDSTTTTGFAAAAEYFYGVNENTALGVQLGYGSIEEKTKSSLTGNKTATMKGMTDLSLKYIGNFDAGAGTFFIFGGFDVPLEKFKINSDARELNQSSGRITPKLGIGFVAPFSTVALGARFKAEFPMEGDVEITNLGITRSGKITEGNSFRIGTFLEIENSVHPNFELSYTSQDEIKLKINGGTGSLPSSKVLEFGYQMRIETTEGFHLLTMAAYRTRLDKSDRDIDTYHDFFVGIAGRFIF